MPKLFSQVFFLVATVSLLTSCASYKKHMSSETAGWESKFPNESKKLAHSIYLIGDAGDATANSSNTAVQFFKQTLDKASANSTALFLGDNIYPSALPDKSDSKKRAEAEAHLDAQIAAVIDYQGKTIFIPGNHDWDKDGVKGLNRQERYIEKALNKGIKDDDDWEDHFLPNDGCAGPEILELTDNLVLVVVDSEWWLADWDKDPRINDGCEIKTRAAFAAQFADAIKDHKNKNIVIATHHPMASYGPHGGHFTLKDHLFPLTLISHDLYLPLPVIGSVLQLIRSSGISTQDVSNPKNKQLQKVLMGPAEGAGEYIFVAGHEHALQYIKKDGQHIIVSGAGSKKSKMAKGKDALLSYGHEGFSKIDFYEDGSAWIEFWIPNEDGSSGELILRQEMKGPLAKPKMEDLRTDFTEYENLPSTSNQHPITTKIKEVGKFENFMLGEHYRNVYLEKFDFPTMDLAQFKGGLNVIKKGGGKQTNSLRFANDNDEEYVMRSLTKDLTRSIPYPFNQMSLVTYLFKDNYLATHPFAPLAVPTLSDAANVYHANPNIYYVPKQPGLEIHNDKFGEEIYIVEERPSNSWPEMASFGNAEKFISTFKLAEKKVESRKYKVDQNWVARSRLFDLLIGDWDRHEDQWRWAVIEQKEKTKLCRPIPRDRDQAFSKYDGFIVKFLKPYNTFLRQLADYGDELNDPAWGTYNTRFFDHDFLNELSWEEWQKEVAYIQEHVTDEVIAEAFSHFPDKVYELSAEEIIRVLKVRRGNLASIAKGFYGNLAKKILLHGTDKNEYFEIKRIDDEHTEVAMYDLNKKGEKKGKPLYYRMVKTSETKEVFIYGLEGDDVFHISGKVNESVDLHLVGGAGKDAFHDESIVKKGGKKDKVYDSKIGNTLNFGSEGKDKTSDVAARNTYDRRGNQYDENTFFALPMAGYNEDDGLLLGFTGIWKKYGFNKSSYAEQHKLSAKYSFATDGLDINYNGEFMEASGRWDFVINANWRNSLYSINYFGFGNESNRDETLDLNYYRVTQSWAHLDFGWQRRFASDVGKFSFRPMLELTDVEKTPGRFIDSDDNGVRQDVFDSKPYLGALAELNFRNVDNTIAPRKGFEFNSSMSWQHSLATVTRQFMLASSDFTLYQPLDPGKNIIFASKIGTALIRGNYDFFYAPSLGHKNNIRGFLRDRYRGRSTFYHQTDLRLTVASLNNPILPFTFGLTGSFDYGKVWEDAVKSDLWHSSYGGGIWIAPLNLAIISLTYHVSDDDELFKINIGHAF